ncbi:M4 family metallopeptidase [Candidatus Neomarinimicrobiota bacterium]
MKNRPSFIICLTVLHVMMLPSFAAGQSPIRDIGLAPDFVAEKVADIVVTPRGSKWLVLRQDARIPPRVIFDEHGDAFLLGDDDRMDIQHTTEDDLGFTHYRFQQKYKGVKVEGAEMLVHARDGYAARTNGNIVTGLNLSIRPGISEEAAINTAIAAVEAETFMWDSPEESILRETTSDSTASYYPAAEFVITRSIEGEDLLAHNFRLAYKVDVYSLVPFDGKAVYIDAQSGAVFKTPPLIHNATGSVSTNYNGTQNFETTYITADDEYILKDESRGNGIHVKEYSSGDDYKDADNNWDSDTRYPASGLWAAEMSFDYFLEEFGRDVSDDFAVVTDNPGAEIDIRYRTNYRNADWSGYVLTLGDGDAPSGYDTYPWVSLEVLGHEFTHIIGDNSSQLGMSGEPRALEESFADIFGKMVEFSIQGESNDYLVDKELYDRTSSYVASRDMANPNNTDMRYVQPDTYEGTNWSSSGDHYINLGVQNFWFYLLAEGGSGTNDNSDSYSVTTIGRDEAAAIAFRNFTQYLWSSSDYADAREGAIWAANDLYTGNEVTQVINAWYAVGVEPNIPATLTLQNETVSDTVSYIATSSISAGPAFTIQSGAQVLFFAGTEIILASGFTASSGSDFTAAVAQGGGTPFGKTMAPAIAANTGVVDEQVPELDTESIPTAYGLSNAYPNPFNPTTVIKYALKEDVRATLRVYNLLGREVLTLVDEYQPAAYYSVVWNGRDATGRPLPSGLYIALMQAGSNFRASTKLVLLK